jgi:hypothetical protein
MAPDKIFSEKERSITLTSDPTLSGIKPIKQLSPMLSAFKLYRPLKSGMGPDKKFELRSKYSKLAILLNDSGTEPARLFPYKDSSTMFTRPLTDSGISPARLLELRSK